MFETSSKVKTLLTKTYITKHTQHLYEIRGEIKKKVRHKHNKNLKEISKSQDLWLFKALIGYH